jgi:hypothetical protein
VVLGVVRIQLKIDLSAKKQSKVRAIPHFQSVILPSIFVRNCLKIGRFLFFFFFFWKFLYEKYTCNIAMFEDLQ